MSSSTRKLVIRAYWIVTLLVLAVGVWLSAYYAPIESEMGVIQKVFYFHLPAAFCMFGACFLVFVAGAGYLWQRDQRWDDLADAAAHVAVLLASVVLLTGMLWAKKAWGQWWTWSPRLTFSLILWLLYVVYLILRASIDSAQKRAMVCAVYGVIAFLDVPLVYLSVKLMDDIHPSSVELEPSMLLTLIVWMAGVALLTAGLVAGRFRLARISHKKSHDASGVTGGMA
ncbi:MAG: hypothetical protein D6695_04435 [Planctomycetota bacterium]|nr:MAG: hypothetical protein D6695_04435 [Planctomycetota bacterium]